MFKKQALSPEVSHRFINAVKSFMSVIEENNNDFAFYKGKIFSEGENLICMKFVVTDMAGSDKSAEAMYNADKNEMTYSSGFSFINEKKVIAALVKFVSLIERFNPPISVVRFDVSVGYKYALIEPSTEDKGCAIVSVIGKFFQDTSYGITSRKKHGDLAERWE